MNITTIEIKKSKIALLLLALFLSVISINAAIVGTSQNQQNLGNVTHNNNNVHAIVRNNPPDDRNSNLINATIINNHQHLIYSMGANAHPLHIQINNSLQRIFQLGQGGQPNNIGAGVPFRAPNHTRYYIFQSGQMAGQLNRLFNQENISIQNAYSNTVGLKSSQGTFYIDRAVNLYHTEAKAFNAILEEIAAVANGNLTVRDVILVSERSICSCCARLLLNVINNLRNTHGFPNVIIMSRAQFLGLGNPMLQNIQNSVNQSIANQLVVHGANLALIPALNNNRAIIDYVLHNVGNAPHAGNSLVLFVHYA